MKRQRKCLRKTQDTLKEKLEVIDMERDIHPPVEQDKINHIFISIAKVYKKDGTVYVDNTGNFPIRSIEGYIDIFILYDWTKNAILAALIKYTKDDTIIEDFQTHIKYTTKRAFRTSFNIIDNVTSLAIKVYPRDENI